MCGIIGFVTFKGGNIESEIEWVIRGKQTMNHRGPDSSAIWVSNNNKVCFGHLRLAILDLSNGGNQPMIDNTRGLSIIFNGEIYNYKELKELLIKKGYSFISQSDTEVLLSAYKEWGVECLQYLNGMFAFAIYDSQKDIIFLARDRAGEKPLFYSVDEKNLQFASELKGLFANKSLSRKINDIAFDSYLSEGYVPGNLSIIDNVFKLQAGNYLICNIETKEIQVKKYWSLPEIDINNPFSKNELVEKLENLLEDSVKKQSVADVSVGILLSGGVDSSLVTAMASRVNSTVNTFTVKFPGYGKFDESSHARLVASYFGTKHTELVAEASSVELLPLLAKQFDEPIIDSSMIPTYLVCKLIKQHCTVVLGGDGADELFGGYSHYDKLLKLQSNVAKFPLWMRSLFVNGIYGLFPTGYKGKNWLKAVDSDFDKDVPLIATYFDRSERLKMLNGSTDFIGSADQLRRESVYPSRDLLQRATRFDFNRYLAEDILVKVDRSSMLNSLEVRAPFLDYRIIDFAFSQVPSSFKASKENKKIILKELTKKVLPPEFDRVRKQGFSIPISSWLETKEWNSFFKEVLFDNDQRVFNHKFISGLFEGQKRGRSNGERLFGLVMFELWRKEYNINL